MMNKKLLLFLISVSLVSCLKKSTWSDTIKLQSFGAPLKIEYYKHNGKAFQYEENPAFTITDREELTIAVHEIENAENAGPWKGAGWDRIKIQYKDTIVSINTNKEVIGLHRSGTFYKLEKPNFITKRIN